MASTPCIHCGQPLPAGAAFCGNCGTRQTPPVQNAPTQLQPPPAPAGQGVTIRANAPPVEDAYGAQYAPPPPPGGYSQYNAPDPGTPEQGPTYPQTFDQKTQLGAPPGYQAGYPSAPPPPPGYAPGPPPPFGPVGVAPWAQPQKGSGRRVAFGCIAAVVLLLVVLVGGGVLAFFLLRGHTSANTPGGSPTSQTGGTNPSATPPTPTIGPNGRQMLDNLNLKAIYAGVTVTIMSAVQEKTDPEYQPEDPRMDVLKIKARLDNSTDPHDVDVTDNTVVIGANGTPYDMAFASGPDVLSGVVSAQTHPTGYWFFDVPHGTHISDWQVMLGARDEVQETIPLNGASYDASMWNETPKSIGKSVPYYNGAIVGTVVKVATGVWTPGYQAPQGMRFILVDLMVTNNTATDVYVGDPEFALLGPDGSRYSQDDVHGYDINVDLGAHASMDVGYADFVVPPAKGDFQMLFFNQDNGIAGMIDLGTL